jgi:hypothetical protein
MYDLITIRKINGSIVIAETTANGATGAEGGA